MELLVTLRKKEMLKRLRGVVDGIVVGTLFSNNFDTQIDDLPRIRKYTKVNNIKLYITIENFISENELKQLDLYLNILSRLRVDGIYFHDLGIYSLAKKYDLADKLIYDGQCVLCNKLDTSFYLNRGINSVVISRELTYEEIMKIISSFPNKIDMQIFGHLRLSYSKRKFLSNYFKQINKDYDYLNKETLYLIEEKRDYKLPIIEGEFGTKIYSDYIFIIYDELLEFKKYLRRGIVESLFIEDHILLQLLRDYKRITKENVSFLKENFMNNYLNNYSSAYLYQKTSKSKDE